MFRRSLLALPVVVAAGAATAAAIASADEASSNRTAPNRYDLPNGFQPEGIVVSGRSAYLGSLLDGSICRVDLVSGDVRIVAEGPGTPAIGMKIDKAGRLFVCGGPAGGARVYDAESGEQLAEYQFSDADPFVNDVTFAYGSAWFTDSFQPFVYRLPLSDGLPDPDEFEAVPITGDFQYGEEHNANGLVRAGGGELFIVAYNTGKLYRVDTRDGVSVEVDLGGETLPGGDGMLWHDDLLYVVEGLENRVAALRVAPGGDSAEVVDRIADDSFESPTTVDAYKNRLLVPNARFDAEPGPDTPYWVSVVDPVA
ncbi:MAG: SMP-30/gluconolactonase/LRE family protein [Stackebrandtia sp.]